jgi:hypothetical protein
MVYFGFYTLGLEPVPFLEASLELLFHDAFQHHLWLNFSLCSVLEFSSLELYLYLMTCFDLRKKDSVLFCLILQVLAIRKSVCFLSSLTRWYNFCSSPPHDKSLVAVSQHVLYGLPRMLTLSLHPAFKL